jgi:hypothetical protein
METSLFLLMLVASITLFIDHRYGLLAVVGTLCVLTRFEAGLILPIMVMEHRRLLRPAPRWNMLLGSISVLLVAMSLNWFFYGNLLPHTASAKIGQGMSGYWGRWPFAFLHARNQLKLWANFYLYLAFSIPAAFYGLRISWLTSWSRIVLRFLVGLLGFYILFNIPAYPWYYAPFFFFLLLYAALGFSSILKDIPNAAFATLAVAISLYGITYGRRTISELEEPRMGYAFLPYRDIGQWLQANTSQSAEIEAAEVGVLGWYAHRKIIDILGLTDPRNAAFIAHREPGKWLSVDRPDYIVIHEKPYIFEAPATVDPRYVDVENFNVPGYRLLRRTDVHPN